MDDIKHTKEEPASEAGKNEIIKLTAEEDDAGERLDVFLSQILSEKTRSFLQKLVKNGNVTINKKAVKAGYKMREGDIAEIEMPSPEVPEILPENIPLDILYEDDQVLIVNKPKGMVVHPAPGHSSGTLVNAVMYHCGSSLSGINGVLRPGIVHRIDRDTTGALAVCKTDTAHLSLSAQLKEHSITRKYVAIVHGNIKEDDGTVDAPIGRHPVDRKKMAINREHGREAVTHYHVLERYGKYTYIECTLETGRTHQIRVHMTSIGHPLLGDEVYSSSKSPFQLQGQTLHAMTLGFIHPTTGQYVEFEAPLPEYFTKLLEILRGK